MIIIKLDGGLGNQMFQYALARHLARKNKSRLKFDLSAFKKNKLRQYQLDIFNIKGRKLNKISSFCWQKIKRYNLFKLIGFKYIKQQDRFFSSRLLSLKGNIYLNGYWQSENYFKNIKEIIKKDFTFKTKLNQENKKMLKKIKNSNAVAIHTRRTDYFKNPQTREIHGLCSLRYYYQAIKKIEKKIKNPHFFIFSDEIKWVKKNLKLTHPAIFVDINPINKGYEDLRLMKNCQHFIIANSTFSWWAAWLSNYKNKLVYAPEKWFAKGREGDIIPKEWLRIRG